MRKLTPLLLCALLLPVRFASGQLANSVNYNSSAPAPPIGSRNVTWQSDHGRPTVNASAYVTFPTKQVACPSSGDLSGPVQTVLTNASTVYGVIIDARACQAATTWTNAISISIPNTVLLLPCATLTATNTLTVPAGVRSVAVIGCSFQGGSSISGTQGGTVWLYQGGGDAFSIGDPTYAVDTPGFKMQDVNVATVSATSTAVALHFYRSQEIRLDNLSLNGNGGTGQTGVILDGTGDYSGGTFIGVRTQQFAHPWVLTGHLSGSVVDDYANASTWIKPHIDCPTSGGSPISGMIGFDVQGGDGNTWAGGDVEGCATVMHFGAAATSNTVVGLRSENSTAQFVADSGSSFNSVTMGGTIFTGQLSDSGTRNSFNDAFHRTVNGITGDWYASQADVSLVDHQRLGIGSGNERGRETEIQTDYGYRWIHGFTDAVSGEQFWHVKDLLNGFDRFAAGQLNHGSGSTNAQTVINSAGSGAVVVNASANSGTGGIQINSGGATPSMVADFDSSGNEDMLGQLNFWAGSTETWQWECASTTICQLRNANATTPSSVFYGYTNGGTEIDSQASAAVVVNNHATSGTGGFIVYQGGANYTTQAFSVNSSGTATAAKDVVITNHLNQAATKDYAGTCAMSGTSTCTVALQHSFTSTPLCFVQATSNNTTGVYCAVSSNNAVVTAAATNSLTWQVLVIGNPN